MAMRYLVCQMSISNEVYPQKVEMTLFLAIFANSQIELLVCHRLVQYGKVLPATIQASVKFAEFSELYIAIS